MNIRHRLQSITLVLGDLAFLYASLFATLVLRYKGEFLAQFQDSHFSSFSILFAAWLIVFYIVGLYDVRRLRNALDFFQTLTAALGINAILAIAFFYLIPSFGITPKTNLFIFIVIFGIVEIIWRRYYNRIATGRRPASKVMLISRNPSAAELVKFLGENPQLGYSIEWWTGEDEIPSGLAAWKKEIETRRINLIVLPRHFRRDDNFSKAFFGLLELEIGVRDLPEFYETVFRKIPLSEIDEGWFLEHRTNQPLLYNDVKRILEVIVVLSIQILILPLEALIALAIKFTSPGPIIYRQVRVGKYGKTFVLYKFRTMRTDAEKHGPQWASANDTRVTPIGKILRQTHLDELPQFANILKGDLSFVGPRPERPEFVAKLREEIPFYEIRTLIKPGLTGWAQIHHRADLTLDDVKTKLEYDIFYLKNRSLILDLGILLKTAKTFFSTPT